MSGSPRRGAATPEDCARRFVAVVPTHQTRALTLRCVAGLFGAGLSSDRLVVVDDASSDDTLAALDAVAPDARLLRNPTRRGFTQSANRGAEAAVELAPEAVALVNSDTVVPSEFFQLAAAALDDEPTGLWAPRLVFPDGRPQWSAGASLPGLAWLAVNASGLLHRPPPDPPPPSRRGARSLGQAAASSREVAWLPATCLVVRRETWLELGGFHEGFQLYAQDLDLCSRAAAAGWRLVLDERVAVLHELGATVRRETPRGRDLVRLWVDLLLWASRHRGPRWAARARSAMLLGGACGFPIDLFRRLSGHPVGYHERWMALRALAAHPVRDSAPAGCD